MKYLILLFVVSLVWTSIEIYRAPMMDETTGQILKPGRKLKDIFKRKRT